MVAFCSDSISGTRWAMALLQCVKFDIYSVRL